jgi:hypothetical protein
MIHVDLGCEVLLSAAGRRFEPPTLEFLLIAPNFGMPAAKLGNAFLGYLCGG